MNDKEFMAIVSDFDGFMRSHGYIRTGEMAEKYKLRPVTIRGWITQGLVTHPDVVSIGNVNYIKVEAKPTKDRSKRKGKYEYDI